MSIIQDIAAKRQQLLDGLDANEGDINLRIFEDFYPDEAHFIYELLQNAEDAGATEVSFELTHQSCAFEHNGTRHFNEQDIRGITGIFNSSKKSSPDKIGKFGVGFKSVFVYTDSPIVYSKDHSFRIVKLVLPEEVPSRPNLGGKTRFEFPFNNPKKNVNSAYAEVKAGLEQLSETTLLFLNNLRYITWKIGSQDGAVLREEHSQSHVEVLKLIDGKEVLSSHWLRFSAPVQDLSRFTAPVEGVERQKVAVAYELVSIGDAKSFDKSIPLAKQLKIRPAAKGNVSVFFPAEKETSGLRFHLHAPFIPELSRASIKNSPENLPLFDQLAVVCAKSLHNIKELGLLTGEFLAVLPNNSDDLLPERYQVIRRAVLEEMRTEPLVPTYGGGFAPSSRLYQARATLKGFLSLEDLKFLTEREDQPEWAISPTVRNPNLDRFLTSLEIQTWEVEDLKDFFESSARKPRNLWDKCELKQSVLSWLATKSFDWFQTLYAVLYKYCAEQFDYGNLQDVFFLRLVSNQWGTGRISYFQSGPISKDDPYLRVDERILTAGTRKPQQQDARKFLEELGVREPDESDELKLLLQSRYGEKAVAPGNKEYVADLSRMIAFLDKNPTQSGMFAKARIFKVASLSLQWATAAQVYLDEPFSRTKLKLLYDLTSDQKLKRWPLDAWYTSCGIPAEKIARFAEQLGCQKEFDKLYISASCGQNPNWNYLSRAPGERAGNVVNRDFAPSPEAMLLLKANQLETARLVWNAMCRSENVRPTILKAYYQVTDRGGPHLSDSQLICLLKEMAWVPQADGAFVKPKAAASARLPKGFAFDAGHKWLEAVEFGTEEKKKSIDSEAHAARRSELGFNSEEELQRAQAFTRLSVDEQQRLLDIAAKEKAEHVELPVRQVTNIQLRQKRVEDEARRTPDKSSEQRPRAVQVGAAEAKAAAKLYLVDQYTNTNGQMICQACRRELPFKLPNGSYYFEAVELLPDSPKRYREAYLALCPNHSAAYQYANAHSDEVEELVATASGNEVELMLGGTPTTLYFTQMHFADARACLDSIESTD